MSVKTFLATTGHGLARACGRPWSAPEGGSHADEQSGLSRLWQEVFGC